MNADQRQARATSADELCRASYDALDGPEAGVALVAVGGYGRGELAPYSDLDVVLVHDDGTDPGELAAQVWYPLWDARWRVDHAVRSFSQMLEATKDLKVALGLLDVRHVAGDPGLSLRLRTSVLADWRRQARGRLPELHELVLKRHAVLGELAHVAVPDIKEAAGGLRDATILRALEATWLVDASTPASESARLGLLDVRDEVHAIAGRAVDRIAPEMWEPLAQALGLPDRETAQRHVRSLGRRVAHLSRLGWRRVDAVLARPTSERSRRTPAMETLESGIAVSRGEVVLDRGARPDTEPALLLRAAAAAAERDLVLAPATVARLVRECGDLPDPWPDEAREALVRLLASGRGLLPVWETLEETGAVSRFLPEWERIALLPHASPIHSFTVDRHVVEACVAAGSLIRSVSRPDVLLVAALLHDIGKGGTQEHSAAGEPIARTVAVRMGFRDIDVDRIGLLVRWHLLLADLATTRDPDDPQTVSALLAHVPDATSLDLLRALTEADARAASAAAWTSWRAALVDRLVRRGVASLGSCPTMAAPLTDIELPDAIRRDPGSISVELSGATVTVVGADRVGLLADVAAAIGLVRIPVHAARAWSQTSGHADWGISTWEIGGEVDVAVLRERLRLVAERQVDTSSLIRTRRPGALPPLVDMHPDASRTAAVLEVRTDDQPGVLHQVLAALAAQDLTVRSAHVSTVGPQAVDVFYVQEVGGVPPSDQRAATAAHAVRAALES